MAQEVLRNSFSQNLWRSEVLETVFHRNCGSGDSENQFSAEIVEQKLEEEVIEAYHERQAKLQRIGSFKFDIDKDLDVEILTSDQVFEDLDDINNIKEKSGDPDGNNGAYKSLVMAMYTRGKKKKKR